MKKLILYFSFAFLFTACTPYYCTQNADKPCGAFKEQAENLVKRLLEHPEDWICILENEKCVDCSYYLNLIRQDKELAFSKHKSFIAFHNEKCKITRIFELTLTEMYSLPEVTKNTVGLCVTVGECRPYPYNDGSIPPTELNVHFKIVNNAKLIFFGISTLH